MPNRDAPRRPTGLSGQEEEALRTLEKGYDPDGGALPDKALPVHDNRDRKPGDDANPVQGGAAGRPRGRPEPDAAARRADSSDSRHADRSGTPHPLRDAERKGLLPSETVVAPPIDRPDDTVAGPVNLDPDTTRRRP